MGLAPLPASSQAPLSAHLLSWFRVLLAFAGEGLLLAFLVAALAAIAAAPPELIVAIIVIEFPLVAAAPIIEEGLLSWAALLLSSLRWPTFAAPAAVAPLAASC